MKTTTGFYCFLFFLVSSCKTVKVSEKTAFTETKYNYTSIIEGIKSLNLNEQEKNFYIASATKIIKTEDENIFNAGGIHLKRKFFKADDTTSVEYFVFEPLQIKNIGVFFIGNQTNFFHYAHHLLELSAKTNSKMYVLNYRGHGNSGGIASFRTQFYDNNKFLELINNNEKRPADYIIGYSLGSVFATYAAVDNEIKNLYLLAPFSNTKELLKHYKKQKTQNVSFLFKPLIRLTTDEYLLQISNTKKIKGYNGSLFLYHGTDDNTLPFKMSKDIYNGFTSPKKELIALTGGHGAPLETKNWKLLIDRIN